MSIPSEFDVRLHVGGGFVIKKKTITYENGVVVLLSRVGRRELTYGKLMVEVKKVVGDDVSAFLWYRKKGKSLLLGRNIIVSEDDINELVESRDTENNLDVWTTTRDIPLATPSIVNLSPKRGPHKKASPHKTTSQLIPSTPLRKSPRFTPILNVTPPKTDQIQITSPRREKLQVRRAVFSGDHGKQEVDVIVKGKQQYVEEKVSRSQQQQKLAAAAAVKVSSSRSQQQQVSTRSQQQKEKEKEKENQKVKEKEKENQKVKEKQKEKENQNVKGKQKEKKKENGKGKQKLKGKGKEKDKAIEDDIPTCENWEDLFEVSEEESDKGDEGNENVDDDIFPNDGFNEEEIFEGNGLGVDNLGDFAEKLGDENIDDDELRSIDGSDNEYDPISVFNPSFDWRNKVTLEVGVGFASVELLRLALRVHSIQNRYDYYFSHNGKDRVTTYCKYKCKCEWDPVRAKIVKCHCKKVVCPIRLHATRRKNQELIVIRTMNQTHKCAFKGKTRKLSSEYLSHHYLEDWRENPIWYLKNFMKRVNREFGVKITYGQAWLVRARAKLLIYGNGADEYKKVWEYSAAIKKYNPGSTAVVMVNNVECPPTSFKRMYICLNACKVGFNIGCRPFLGVDGCHLKGAYPGMCLVAVAMDGNNNLYPVAWAVVEVENAEVWCWFLRLLIEDLGKHEGNGLTIMSDRQKVMTVTYAF